MATDEIKEDLDKWTVEDVLSFASASLGLGSATSPMMLNQALKSITLGATGEISEEEVQDALKAPRESEDQLRRISQSFFTTSPVYKRLLSYMGNILSFDYTFIPIKKTSGKTNYGANHYKKDVKILESFMDSFDVKQEFSKVVKQLFQNETFFSVLRDEDSKFVLQELPQDRSMITGKFSHGLLFSFDYTYFLEPGIDIDFFPSVFKKTLLKLEKGIDQKGYNPSSTLLGRGNHGFAQYVDCSPEDNFWMFKLSPEIVTRIPYFVGLFPDLVNANIIRELQKNSYLASANKLIVSHVPMLSGKAAVKDALSMSPVILGKFLALVKSALETEAVKFTAVPLENTESFEFKADPDINASYLRNTINSSGVSSNLLFSSDAKANTIESQLSLEVDELLVESLYPQFANFIAWNVNKNTKHYDFKLIFEGTQFSSNREKRLEETLKLADRGIVLPQKIAASVGMSPFDMQKQMEMVEEGWVEKLTPLKQSGQMSKDDEDVGAPEKKDSELTESGEETRSSGGNLEKK